MGTVPTALASFAAPLRSCSFCSPQTVIEDYTLVRPLLQAQAQVQDFLEDHVFHMFLLSDQYRRYILC